MLSTFLAIVTVLITIPLGGIIIDAQPITAIEEMGKLGHGFNMLGEAELCSNNLANYQIFKSVENLSMQKISGSFSSSEFTYIKDMNTFLNEQSASASVSLDASAKFKIFSLQAKYKYGISSNSSSETSREFEYAILKHYATRLKLTLDLTKTNIIERIWNQNPDGTYVTLNDDFVDSLLNDDPEFFFNKYGTHILTQYTAGGEMYVVYEGLDLGNRISGSTSWNTNITVGADISALGSISADIGATGEVKDYKDATSSDISMKSDVLGGSGVRPSVDELLAGGTETSNRWCESMTADDETNLEVLTDRNLQFISVWSLLVDDKYSDRRVELEQYFNEHISEDYAEFYGEYVYTPSQSIDFSGYTFISTASDFNNIRQNLNGKYVLLNNIDLSSYGEWAPIGTKSAPFTGTINGNGNTVSGLNITKCDSYAGLLGYNAGTVENLTVSGNINVDGSGSAGNVAYIGGIAGYNRGTVSNCRNLVAVNGKMTADGEETAETVTDEFFTNYSAAIENAKNAAAQKPANNSTISVGLTPVHLTGTATGVTLNVTGTSANDPAYIVLDNAVITGTIKSDSNRKICIISIGKSNSVTGSANTVAINAAKGDLYLTGDAPLTVTGGNGTRGADGSYAGASGSKGNDGKEAICAANSTINMQAELTLKGGNGGNGGDGLKGVNGTGHQMSKNGAYTGGSNAGNGGNGGNGGKGANALNSNIKLAIYNGRVYSLTGSSGDGGDGGHGGNGGDGGDAYGGKLENYAGAGTLGGRGGNGGNCGDATTVSTVAPKVYNNAAFIEVATRSLGKGGNGGNGGKGGNGGNGMLDASFLFDGSGYPGIHGAPGSNGGNGGNGGSGAIAGSYGYGGYAGSGGNAGVWYGVWPNNGEHKGNAGDSGNSGSRGSAGSIRALGITVDSNLVSSASKYTIYPTLKTWEDANKTPENEKLASIGSAEEQALIKELLEISGCSNSSLWLGLRILSYDAGTETAICEWSDGARIKIIGKGSDAKAYRLDDNNNVVGETYVNFRPGEPNNFNNNEFYIHLDGANGAEWNDNDGGTKFGYLTEKSLADPKTASSTDKNALLIGGICGYNAGTVKSAYNSAKVAAEKVYSAQNGVSAYAGGICGYNNGNISDSVNTASVKAFAVSDSVSFYAGAYAKNICSGKEGTNCGGYVAASAVAYSANALEISDGDEASHENEAVRANVESYWKNSELVINDVAKTEYIRNSEFDNASLDMSFKGEPVNVFGVRSNFYKSGTSTVIVTYTEGADTYVRRIPVKIIDEIPETLEVYQLPKTEFIVGDTFSYEGLIVKLVYNNGNEKLLSSKNLNVSEPNMKTIGTKTVEVSYEYAENECFGCTYDINVAAESVIGIQIVKLPDQLSYAQGDNINLTGMKVEKIYNSGRTENIPLNQLRVNYSFLGIGEATVTVNYSGFTAEFSCTVSQADTDAAVALGSKFGSAGSTVEIPVIISDNPGVASLLLTVTYDESVLTLINVKDTQLISGENNSSVLSSPYQLTWMNPTIKDNILANGTIAYLVFEVAEDAELGEYEVKLSYNAENFDIVDVDMNPVFFKTVDAVITVIDVQYGDVNRDGKVNLLDSTILARYVAKWPDYTADTIDMRAADVNNDGKVNLLDSTILARHVAKWPDYAELPYEN